MYAFDTESCKSYPLYAISVLTLLFKNPKSSNNPFCSKNKCSREHYLIKKKLRYVAFREFRILKKHFVSVILFAFLEHYLREIEAFSLYLFMNYLSSKKTHQNN